jgi:L-amino acid N-acyltransferase YncA
MLAASVADDGILGYATPLSDEDGTAFCDDLQRRLSSGEALVLLGEDERGTVAMCVAAVSSMPNCRHIAEISKAFLDPRVRRGRAVTELVAAVCTRMAAEGVELLRIDVREGSPAHRVWTRFGFTTFGVLEDYSRVGDARFRGHFMQHSVAALSEFAADRLRSGASTVGAP